MRRQMRQVLSKIETDLVAFLPSQKELWCQHLEVVVPHLVVGHHQGFVFQGRVHPEPIVVHSRRGRVQEAPFFPGIAQRAVFMGEHVPRKVPVVHDQENSFPEIVSKMVQHPIDLFVIDVLGGRPEILFEVANVGTVDDDLVGVSCVLDLAFQKLLEPLPFLPALLGRKIRPPFSLSATLKLAIGVALDASVGDDRFVHDSHNPKGRVREGDRFEGQSLEAPIF
mmetsp:Transcript_21272/g.44804  ORF Transcript_21272/g.44804 Transcript_21272/m.44804 type:complete len:224 (-) Transcript_21272:1622-2293(-)